MFGALTNALKKKMPNLSIYSTSYKEKKKRKKTYAKK